MSPRKSRFDLVFFQRRSKIHPQVDDLVGVDPIFARAGDMRRMYCRSRIHSEIKFASFMTHI